MKIKFAFLLIFLLSLASFAGAVTYNAIYAFQGGSNDASNEYDTLLNVSGTLYGVSFAGGNSCGESTCGVVFKLTESGGTWTESVIYKFSGTDGQQPSGPLVADSSGNLYGVTGLGGANGGFGTVFELSLVSSAWTLTTIHAFNQTDGATPVGVLLYGGKLYGVTELGGAYSQGTIFQLAYSGGSWSLTTLHDFTSGSDGSIPNYGLIVDSSDVMYGTTSYGGGTSCGGSGCGTVYSLTYVSGSWTESVVYTFANNSDGKFPDGLLYEDSNGNLFGTTQAGGSNSEGTAFELIPGTPWTKTKLWDFGGTDDGQKPFGNLIDISGNLYGVSFTGGAHSCSCGTIYKLTPPATLGGNWSEAVVYSFANGSDGENPSAGLIQKGSTYYGLASLGGSDSSGVAFSFAP